MSDSEHYVVAGGGRVGRRVARHFADRGVAVTVIERDSEAITTAAESGEVEYLVGDATRPSLLREAIGDRTTVLGALTANTDTNLAVCMAATKLDGDLKTVARIDDADGDAYTEYVDEVYFPERASVDAAVNALSSGDVRLLEGATGDLNLLDVRVDFDAPAAGQVVADALPEGSVVVARTDGDVAVQHSTKLVGGRRYVVAADEAVVDEVIEQFRGTPDA
jgi:trk system potassium uptake protein TrkA